MGKPITLDQLRKHLEHAKSRLSLEKAEIIKLHPLPETFNREEYAFAYVRAERLGMRAINRRLAEISWLPMQLDPRTEIMSESRSSMKRWLMSALSSAPDSDEFGNDFMHALTRCGMEQGWESPDFIHLTKRIANLFRDLSCLIGLIYYCSWLSENRVDEIYATDPDNLNRTAEEVAALIQSPEILRLIRAREQDTDKIVPTKKLQPSTTKKARPALYVIPKTPLFDGFTPDPVMV